MARPLRIAARLLLMFAWFALCTPAFYLFKPFTRHNPVPSRFMAGIARIAGARVEKHGIAHRPRAILLANHVSWLDVPLLAATSGTAFVAHDGLAKFRFLKWLCDMNNTVFISRHRRSTVARQIADIRDALHRTAHLALFPEGTTSDGRTLLPMKSALLSAIEPPPPGVAVQPVFLDYGRHAGEIAWFGEETGVANFLRILGRSKGFDVAVKYLPALTHHQLSSRKAIASAVSHALESARRAP